MFRYFQAGVLISAILLQAAVAIAAPAPAPAQARQKTVKAAASAPASTAQRPFRSSADPTADPNKNLKSCLDHVGLNPVARDRCMRQHCEGRWGQSDCPASGGNILPNKNAAAHTPLGLCLSEAGKNPFKRNACGWKHCRNDWDRSECAPFKAQPTAYPN